MLTTPHKKTWRAGVGFVNKTAQKSREWRCTIFVKYEHTQPGTLIRWLLMIFLTFGVVLLCVAAVTSQWQIAIPGGMMMLISCVILLLFHALTVTVTQNEIQVSYGVGIISMRFPISEIKSASAVRNAWWYGWGIRYTPHGWLYNVSGLDAVEVVYHNDRKYRIGTNEPQALLTAIEAALTDSNGQ